MTDWTDEERFAEHGRQLAAAIDAVIEPWVTRCVTETCAAAGIPVDDRVRDAASDAARRCRRQVAAEMAALVAADVDAQTVTPLQVLRTSVRFPTEALVETPLNDIDMGIAQIDRAACYPWVDRGICGACVSVCPLGERAIGFEMWNQYRPVIKDGCVGCGLCVEVCPEPSLPIWIVDRAQGTVAKHRV